MRAKIKELKNSTVEELTKKLAKVRRELLELRFQKTAQQLTNPNKLKESRREIARILTVSKEKEKESGKGKLKK